MNKLEVYFFLAIGMIIFSILIQVLGGSFTGLTTVDTEFSTVDFGTEAVVVGIKNLAPYNMSGNASLINRWHDDNRKVNFTYNVSTDQNRINNCTLWMDIDNAGYEANETLNRSAITQVINQTINETFQSGIHKIIWKVGCYDDAYAQTNTSTRRLNLNYLVKQSEPNIGANLYLNDRDLAVYYSFERLNGSGDVIDETGLHNGTVKIGTGAGIVGGDVRWVPDEIDSKGPLQNRSGRVGKALELNSYEDVVIIENSNAEVFNWSEEQTMCIWFNKKGNSSFVSRNDIWFHGNVAGFDNFRLYDRGVAGSGYGDLDVLIGNSTAEGWNLGSFRTNSWHHACVIHDNSSFTVYFNGQNVFSMKYIWSGDYTDFTIGSDGTGSFNGTVDEFAIWNRSLTNEEIKQIYYSSAVNYNATFTVQDISIAQNNTLDYDNDTIKYIYNWYVNNKSFAVVNMPFEAVNNGSEMNFSRDYSEYENHGRTYFNNSYVHTCEGTAAVQSCSGWNRTGGYDGFGAYDFDGENDYINISNKAIASMNTTSLWFKNATIGWRHIVNASGTIYINGTTGTASIIPVMNVSGDIIIGMIDSTTYFNGTIDEVMIFNRTLSAEQIKALYLNQTQTIKSSETVKGQSWKAEITLNDGYGDAVEYNTSEIIIDAVILTVENQGPVNHFNSSTYYINFTYNVSDAGSVAGVINCSLWLYKSGSWELNKTDYSVDATGINQTLNITIEDGEYNWTIGCYDKDEEQTNSTSLNLTIDTSIAAADEGTTGGISRSTSRSATIRTTTTQQGMINFIEFHNPFIPVISIELQLNQEATLKLKVKRVFETFLSNKVDNAYSYFKIEANLNDDSFEFINLNFKVKKSYDNVELHQLFDQGNNKINVIKIYEDKKYNYYQAPLNSLGYFAITAEPHMKLLSGSLTKTLEDIKVNKNLIIGLIMIVLTVLIFNYIKINKKKPD